MKVRSLKHRKYISEQPCMITNKIDGVQAHHLLRVDSIKGMGTKSCDSWCVPLHHEQHAMLHSYGNEEDYFNSEGWYYDQVRFYAMTLAADSPDKKIRESRAVSDYIKEF